MWPIMSALTSRSRTRLLDERPGGVAFVVEVRGVGLVDEDLQRDAKLLAVVQHAGVRVRNAPWADVDVQTLVERADLTLAADLGVFSAPRGRSSSARRRGRVPRESGSRSQAC